MGSEATHVGLTSLDVADTVSDTVFRGHVRFSTDGSPRRSLFLYDTAGDGQGRSHRGRPQEPLGRSNSQGSNSLTAQMPLL